ncbi:ATP-binding protein [Streptomyces lydicus]
MRRITTAHLRQWKVSGPTADHLVLAVSELVTNGTQHGQEDIGLNVRYTPGEVRVEVTDGSPRSTHLRGRRKRLRPRPVPGRRGCARLGGQR